MDLHHNLFYSYRGPIADDISRERQLENNLTKALINTLELGGESVWRPFLAKLVLAHAEPAFLLQRRDIPGGAKNKRECVLLGISRQESAWAAVPYTEPVEGSLPDGWMYGDGYAILVESKVNGDFVGGQMCAHLEILRSSDGTLPKIELMTWKQLHRLFAGLLPNQKDNASRLLVEQFIQFLEYCGMSGFNGFRPEHFHYLVLHDDEDARRWILEQVNDLATQVQSELHNFAPMFYESYDIGTLKNADSYCWCALGPHDRKYRDVTHQTMSLAANGLSLFVNAELKTATDRVKHVVQHAGNAFRDALQELHNPDEPFELVLQERTQRQASLYDYTPKLRIHSSMLANPSTRHIAWDAISQTIQQLPLFQLMIERLVPPPRLLGLSSSDARGAVQHVVDILKRNHAVVSMLNA